MIHNPFISQFYPGLTAWLNFAQLYQAVPEDYEITRVGKGFRISAASKNKGAKGVVAVEYNRTPVGYLDPTEPIYFDKEEFDGGVSLATQILHNTTISLADKLIDRFETNDEGGVLHLKAGTPWGEEPVSIPVKFYNVKSVVSELTFRLTENKTISFEWLTEGSVTLNKKTYTSNSPSLTLEAGEHHFSSDQPLGVLGTLFEQLGKPLVTNLIRLKGNQAGAVIEGTAELFSSIQMVSPECIKWSSTSSAELHTFKYFSAPTTNIKGPLFASGTVINDLTNMFAGSIVDRFPDGFLRNVNPTTTVIKLNKLFKESEISYVQSTLFEGGLGDSLVTGTECDYMFDGVISDYFDNDVLMSLPAVISMAGILTNSSLPSIPRVIPKDHKCGSFNGLYRNCSVTRGVVDSEPFRWADSGTTKTYSFIGIFQNSNIHTIDQNSDIPLTKLNYDNNSFSGTLINILPKNIYNAPNNAISYMNSTFWKTPIVEIPDNYLRNCVNLTTATHLFADCTNLVKVGKRLFGTTKGLDISELFAGSGKSTSPLEIDKFAFSDVSIAKSNAVFTNSYLAVADFDAIFTNPYRMFQSATVDIIPTHGLRLNGDIGSLFSGASIGVLATDAVILEHSATDINVGMCLDISRIGLLGKRIFSSNITHTTNKSTRIIASSLASRFNTLTELLYFLNLNFDVGSVLSVSPIVVNGSYQKLIDAQVGPVTLESAKALIPSAPRFTDTDGGVYAINSLKTPSTYLGYQNNGLVPVRPIQISYFNNEYLLDGISRIDDPENWFKLWSNKQPVPTLTSLHYHSFTDYDVFSPCSELTDEDILSEYNYVFRKPNVDSIVDPISFTDPDWLYTFVVNNSISPYVKTHGTVEQIVTTGTDGIGRFIFTPQPEYSHLYNTVGNLRINGFYGSLQRIISTDKYRLPLDIDYTAITKPELCAVILSSSGYEFSPDQLSGEVNVVGTTITIGLQNLAFLGPDIKFTLA